MAEELEDPFSEESLRNMLWDERTYRRFTIPAKRALQQLRLELEFFVEDTIPGNVYQIEDRVKSFESALKKARERKIRVEELDDIAGLRVVVATTNDVEVIAQFFYRMAAGADASVLKNRKVDHMGYKATHIHLEIDPHYSRSPLKSVVEVQLQTILQHAFNFLSRRWSYKAAYKIPGDVRDELVSISKETSVLDQRISAIFENVVANAQSTTEDLPLTPHSFRRILKEAIDLDISINHAVGIARQLVMLGYVSNKNCRDLLTNESTKRVIDRLQASRHGSVRDFYKRDLFSLITMLAWRMPNIEGWIAGLEERIDKESMNGPGPFRA